MSVNSQFSIRENLEYYLDRFENKGVQLVAVSKKKSVEEILEAYQAGQRVFGENTVQELIKKAALLPSDIEWHFLGHLQTNKVKYITPFIKLIQSVDSEKLLHEINNHARKINRTVDCLIEIHIAQEDSKQGLTSLDAIDFFTSVSTQHLNNIRIRGLMGIASFTENTELISKEFIGLKNLFNSIKSVFYKDYSYFNELSMGMSNDYQIAIEEGATMVRIGTGIFGERSKL